MPLVTDKHIVAHMPKTGGCWLIDYLRRTSAAQFIGPAHSPITWLREDLRATRIGIGALRDPWSWYVSWYQHAMASPSSKERARRLGNGSTAFKNVLHGATQPEWAEDLPRQFGCMWIFERSGDLRESFLRSGAGLYTWTMRHIYAPPEGVSVFLDTSRLHESLAELLGRLIDPDDHPPVNTRRARPQSVVEDRAGLMDAEAIRRIAEAEQEFIEEMGYEGPGSSARRAVHRMRR